MTPKILKLVQEVGSQFTSRRFKLAVSESCTGGGLGYAITSATGSSDWFDRGFITYSNDAKHEMIAVKLSTLDQFGAVSEPTAREMAEGTLRHSQADVGMAITGIAGPKGGTSDKPVGTVWFAYANKKGNIHTAVDVFSGNRESIRMQSIEYALTNLLLFLQQDDNPR